MMPAPSSDTLRNRTASASLALAFALLVATPLPGLAQDAGVSGIPPGPGNINGLNNSLRDPSGVGNAARIPALPPPNLSPVPVPEGVPLTSTQPSYMPRARYAHRWRHLSKKQRQKLERAAVKENDRLLGRGVSSICRGC
jgi:hypothetical protein